MQKRDDILLERIKISDDQKAFEYLYHLYYSSLCRYVIGFVKNYADAEDLVNDCFFEIWKNRKTFEIVTSFKAYLFISARNRAINFLKKRKSRNRYLSYLSYPLALQEEINSQTEKMMEVETLEERLKKAIEQLPDQCRYIFYLSRYERLKYRDIAGKLKLSEATVKTQVARALKSLRHEMGSLKTLLLTFFFWN